MKLTAKEKRVLEEFKRRIQEKYPDEILEVLVFGSKARGDATEESDVDIMVVTRSHDRKLNRNIGNIGCALEIEHNLVFSILVYSQENINYLRGVPTQFIQNVDCEAIAL